MSVLEQLSKYAPGRLKSAGLYRKLSRERRIRRLRQQISIALPLRVVIGSGPTNYDGWLTTDKSILDVTSPSDWSALFAPDSIDLLLAEHVLEHLTEAECESTLGQCYRYLKPGGLFRIAVPDGNRRDQVYVDEVSPPNAGHKVLYNVETLCALLEKTGFSATPLEYFDQNEEFHSTTWDESDGYIQRSVRFDTQAEFKRGNLFFTSLIVDARKV